MNNRTEEQGEELLAKIVKLADQSFPVKCGGVFVHGATDKDGQSKRFVGITVRRTVDQEILANARLFLEDSAFRIFTPSNSGTVGQQCKAVHDALAAAWEELTRPR